MLSKDEVCSSELINLSFSLLLSVESASLLLALTNLLLKCDISHFISSNSSFLTRKSGVLIIVNDILLSSQISSCGVLGFWGFGVLGFRV